MAEQKERVDELRSENLRLKQEIESLKARVKLNYPESEDEDRFRKLFDEMNSASALHKMLYDENGNPVDYVFIRVNKLFEKFTGLKAEDIIGKTVLEIMPDTEKFWIEKYGEVLKTGNPISFENYAQALDHYYNVRAYRSEKDHFVVTFVDITAQKKSEKKVNETKSFYEKILETVEDGIWVANNQDVIIYTNRGMAKIAGVSIDNIVGKNVLTDFSEETTGEFLLFYKQAKKTLQPVEYNATVITPAGKTIQSGWLSPIVEGKECKGVICSIQDTTERSNIQDALKESEEKLRNIIEHSTNVFFSHTVDHELTFMSPQSVKVLGYTPEELFIKWMDLTTDNPINMIGFGRTEEAIRTGEIQEPYELELKHKSGKHVWVEVKEAPLVKDGNTVAIVGALTDITNRKVAEMSLQENEIRFQDIIQNLNGIIYRCKCDEDWTMLFLSAGVEKLTGYVANDILHNNKLAFNDIIHPDDREMVGNKVVHAVEQNETYILEYRLVSKSREIKWVYEQGNGIKNLEGELTHLEGYIFDISDRKKMELEIVEKNKEIAAQNEEFLSMNEELQTTVEHIKNINDQLRDAKMKAEESDRLKSAFLANMSHEIRTPMNSIIGFSGLLVVDDLSVEKRNYYSNLILSAGEQLLTIIDDIVDIAKIESNQLKIEKSYQKLDLLFEDIYAHHKQGKLLQQKPNLEFRLKKNVKCQNCQIYTDPVRFKQVANNLISNAIKNTYGGSVEFGVHELDAEKNQIIFYVSDTGVGISEENQKKIFERFVQVKTENLVPGTGLGLSITKGILNLMGGDIWLESELNIGTAFYFSLPFNQNQDKQTEEEYEKRSFTIPELKNHTVFIAEDDYASYILLKEILEITNANLQYAQNGAQLVDMVKTRMPDLILADINMPIIDGIEATKQIRSMGIDVPIIAQTAYALLEEKEDCLKAGCSAYISKPIDANLLFELINQNMDIER